MKKIKDVWSVVYKETGHEPRAFSYTLKEDALQTMQMVMESNGEAAYDEEENFVETIELEWCYLIDSKLIEG